MREVNVKEISDAVRDLSMTSNFVLGDSEIKYLKKMMDVEESPAGKEIFSMMLEINARMAPPLQYPRC